MQMTFNRGAVSLILAALASGCAPLTGTTPQANATGDTYAQSSYTAPAGNYGGGTGTDYNSNPNSGYDYSGGNNGATAGASGGSSASYYDYGSNGANNGSAGSSYNAAPSSYDSYSSGNGNGGSGNSGSYDYSAGSSSGGGDYGNYGGSSSGSGGSSGSASGRHAVQVVASGNRSTAEAMKSQMQSAGFTAVVDQVGGLYKVRVPYKTSGEARASLSRIRGISPDAFITTR